MKTIGRIENGIFELGKAAVRADERGDRVMAKAYRGEIRRLTRDLAAAKGVA